MKMCGERRLFLFILLGFVLVLITQISSCNYLDVETPEAALIIEIYQLLCKGYRS